MFDTTQSTTIDRLLETPEERLEALKGESFLEEIRQEDELETFQDYEFIEMLRSEIRSLSETEKSLTAEIAEQLPYAPVKQRFMSWILRSLGWRYFHRVEEGVILENIEFEEVKRIAETPGIETSIEVIEQEKKKAQPPVYTELFQFEEPQTFQRLSGLLFITKFLLRIRKYFFKSNIVIGIDIGTKNVKFVQLKKTKSELVLNTYKCGEIDLSEDFSREQKNDAIALAIQKIAPYDFLQIAEVIVSISSLAVVTKTETFPLLEEKEMIQAVHLRAQKLVPETLAEPEILFEIIEKTEVNETPQVLVRIYIIDKNELLNWLQLLTNCGIIPDKLTFPHRAVQENLRNFYPREMVDGVMVFDFGGTKSQLLFANKGTVKLIRDIDVGAIDFTASLIGTLTFENISISIDRKTAEELLQIYGITETNDKRYTESGIPVSRIGILLYDLVEKLVLELQRSIDFYRANDKDARVGSILLTGGGADINLLPEKLQSKLNIPVKRFTVSSKLIIGRDITDFDQLLQDVPALHGAIGLALDSTQELNLLPEEKQEKRIVRVILFGIGFIYFIVMGVIFQATVNISSELKGEKSRFQEIESEWSYKQSQWGAYNSLLTKRNSIINIQKQITDLSKLQTEYDTIENILKVFSQQQVPSDIIINQIIIHEKKFENVLISGVFQPRQFRNITVKGKTLLDNSQERIIQYIIYLRSLNFFERITVQPYEGKEYDDKHYFQISLYVKDLSEDGKK